MNYVWLTLVFVWNIYIGLRFYFDWLDLDKIQKEQIHKLYKWRLENRHTVWKLDAELERCQNEYKQWRRKTSVERRSLL